MTNPNGDAQALWNELLRLIDEGITQRLQTHRFSLSQSTGVVPQNQLPSGGNTGGGYTPASHTHPTGQIDGFDEAVQDIIGAKVVAGSNVTVSYNDSTGETTIGVTGLGTGDMLKSTYDTDDDGIVDAAESVPWTGITGAPSSFAPATHASSHQHGGGDEIATATPGANAIPKAGGAGTLDDGWLSAAIARVASVQPLDADLTALAALGGTGLAVRTAANTWAQRSIVGTASRLSVTNGDGAAGNPTLDIDAAYVGQASITTLGTIATGTWQGTVIGSTYGGTGVNNGGRNLTISSNSGTLAFSSGGELGIGLTNPSAIFHAKRTDGNYQYKSESSSRVHGWGTSGNDFFFDDITGGARRLTLTSNGSFGIGTASPVARFEVVGGYGRITDDGSNNPPSSGKGLELQAVGDQGLIVAYNRSSSAYLPLFLHGSSVNVGFSGGSLGFYGTTAAGKQSVTGNRGGTLAQLQTVVGNLLNALATIGLITNSTTVP